MHTVYGGTKAALESVTRTWAVELGHEYGVTVNSINPGPVATDMWLYVKSPWRWQRSYIHYEYANEAYSAMPEDALEGTDDYMKNTPAAPRIGEVDDIVQIVAFLSEEGSRWVNGSNTCANGGALFS